MVKKKCRFFKGDAPCEYHKRKGVLCNDCQHYSPVKEKILIIKLGAAGDVIRTTPILRKIKEEFPASEITWLSYFPEIMPLLVDNNYALSLESVLILMNEKFDFLFNLDKDRIACLLAKNIRAKVKKGFILKGGKCAPVDADVRKSWLLGISDNLKKKNKKTYQEEIFEICGFKYRGERYLIELPKEFKNKKNKKKIIGLYTGCGNRWLTKRWPEKHWIALAKSLKKKFEVRLFAGEKEDELNKKISKVCRVRYSGYFSLKRCLEMLNEVDAVVTTDTLGLHLAIALGKKIVALFGPTSWEEIDLYGQGVKIYSSFSCLKCYKKICDVQPNCMDVILPSQVEREIKRLISLR